MNKEKCIIYDGYTELNLAREDRATLKAGVAQEGHERLPPIAHISR